MPINYQLVKSALEDGTIPIQATGVALRSTETELIARHRVTGKLYHLKGTGTEAPQPVTIEAITQYTPSIDRNGGLGYTNLVQTPARNTGHTMTLMLPTVDQDNGGRYTTAQRIWEIQNRNKDPRRCMFEWWLIQGDSCKPCNVVMDYLGPGFISKPIAVDPFTVNYMEDPGSIIPNIKYNATLTLQGDIVMYESPVGYFLRSGLQEIDSITRFPVECPECECPAEAIVIGGGDAAANESPVVYYTTDNFATITTIDVTAITADRA